MLLIFYNFKYKKHWKEINLMLSNIFSDPTKEVLFQQYCSKLNTKLYNSFMVYLIVPMLYLSFKGIYLYGEIAHIVKECIVIIVLFYLLIRLSEKLFDLKLKQKVDQIDQIADKNVFTQQNDNLDSLKKGKNAKPITIEKNIINDFSSMNQNMAQLLFCFSIIFLYIVQVWVVNPAAFKKYSSNYWFYSGSSLESIRAFLYSSKLKWQNIMFTSFFLNFLLLINFIRLNENNDATYFQIIFPFITSNVVPFFFYLHEKNLRKIFEENLNYQIKLKSYENLIKNILPEQVLILNEGELMFCNEECKRFNGLTDTRAILTKFKTSYFEFDTKENMIDFISRRNIRAKIDFQAKRIDSSSNECLYFNVKVEAIDWQNKEHLLVLLHDITAVKNLERMKEMDEYKDQLLANVSHDLRTPLHGIMGILEMVSDKITERALRSELKIAMKCSNLLLFMINDILDYSQINKGKLGLSIIKTNVSAIVEEVYNMVKFQAKKKGLQFQMSISDRLKNFNFNTDPRRLQQILLNLLSNAIKFTAKGEVILNIDLTDNNIRFIVQDTGIGISETSQKKLFHLYSKLNTGSINREGIGLGLVISKHLLNSLCKNDIRINSQVGVGSIFEFDIPIDEDIFEDINEEKESADIFSKKIVSYALTKEKVKTIKKVLIVEDDQISLFVMCKLVLNIKYF